MSPSNPATARHCEAAPPLARHCEAALPLARHCEAAPPLARHCEAAQRPRQSIFLISQTLRRTLIAALLALTSCGFTPLYGAAGPAAVPVAQQLAEVQVQNIPERPGQLLRQAIEDQLYLSGPPTIQRYSLAVAYSIAQQGIGIQTDTSITRNRFIATASWALTPAGTPATPLITGSASTENAENIIDQQPFAQTLETNTINQQLATTIAQQITTQLAAYFKSHPTP